MMRLFKRMDTAANQSPTPSPQKTATPTGIRRLIDRIVGRTSPRQDKESSAAAALPHKFSATVSGKKRPHAMENLFAISQPGSESGLNLPLESPKFVTPLVADVVQGKSEPENHGEAKVPAINVAEVVEIKVDSPEAISEQKKINDSPNPFLTPDSAKKAEAKNDSFGNSSVERDDEGGWIGKDPAGEQSCPQVQVSPEKPEAAGQREEKGRDEEPRYVPIEEHNARLKGIGERLRQLNADIDSINSRIEERISRLG